MKTYLPLAAVVASMVFGLLGLFTYADKGPLAQTVSRDLYLKQLDNNDAVPGQIDQEYAHRRNETRSQTLMYCGSGLMLFAGAYLSMNRRAERRRIGVASVGPAKPTISPEL